MAAADSGIRHGLVDAGVDQVVQRPVGMALPRQDPQAGGVRRSMDALGNAGVAEAGPVELERNRFPNPQPDGADEHAADGQVQNAQWADFMPRTPQVSAYVLGISGSLVPPEVGMVVSSEGWHVGRIGR